MSVRLAWGVTVALSLLGCSSASFDAFGGAPTSTNDDAAPSNQDVALPDAPMNPDAGGGMNVSDSGVPSSGGCGPAADAGMSNLCVRVTKGADAPPITTAESTTLGIDASGTLLVALSVNPPRKASDLVAVTTLPSVSSGAKFGIADLPKVAELAVPPGKYYVLAVFHDAPPYARNELMIGDWAPRAVDAAELPQVDLTDPSQGVALELPIYPVRGFDVSLSLSPRIAPLGSGAGPARVVMNRPAGARVGRGTLSCGSVANGGTALVRVLTPFEPGDFTLEGALYDFATGPDDPSLDATALPAGTLATTNPSALDVLETGWLGAPRALTLDRVIPFTTTAVPPDPTSACYAFATTQ